MDSKVLSGFLCRQKKNIFNFCCFISVTWSKFWRPEILINSSNCHSTPLVTVPYLGLNNPNWTYMGARNCYGLKCPEDKPIHFILAITSKLKWQEIRTRVPNISKLCLFFLNRKPLISEKWIFFYMANEKIKPRLGSLKKPELLIWDWLAVG